MSRRAWVAVIAGEIIGLCCCAGLFGVALLGNFGRSTPPPPTLAQVFGTPTARLATAIVAPTEKARPTFTLVVQPRTPSTSRSRTTPASSGSSRVFVTPPSNLYAVVVPTPTAPPKLAYPVDYQSTFVVVTYPVTGTTAAAVSKSLEASALPDPHEPNSRYYARADWHLSAHWLWAETPRGCEVDRGDVAVALTMTLPALVTPNVPSDLQNRWSAFIKKAIIHEEGHVRLAQEGARTYQRELGNFSPAPNCDVLQRRLRDLFDKNFAAIDQVNVRYDAETQHGVTQGAVFP